MIAGAAAEAAYKAQLDYLLEYSPFYREKLASTGLSDARDAGGLNGIGGLPFTEKDELRRTRTPENPIGAHLAVSMSDVVRIYSTSGTTGAPSYIPLTAADLANWITISSRSYGASGMKAGEMLVSTYNAGPFAAGAALDAFAALGICHVPVGSGSSDRLLSALTLLKPDVVALTPAFALHLAELAETARIDLARSSVRRLLVAGEPGGGELELRARLQAAWGARVTEAMGIGDIAVSLWGECEHQTGMHFSGEGLVHAELVDPDTGAGVEMADGAEGELVYTHLNHRAAPLLRFRSRDHVRVWTSRCACGRDSIRVRCIGRTDDMLIVRGVNVFPSALREVVTAFAGVPGPISILPRRKGPRQAPPLNVIVEVEGDAPSGLAAALQDAIRAKLLVTTQVTLVPTGTLPRTAYKSKLVDWSEAGPEEKDAT